MNVLFGKMAGHTVRHEFGKYRLIKRLAVGGMAEIWLAKQTGVLNFEKLVVIKAILSNLTDDTDFIEMFLDEARLAASLTHPNVVQIFDLGNVDTTFFIAMEFIPGHDLHAILKKSLKANIPLPPELAALIVANACEGLHYAHTRKDHQGIPLKIVHRDVSLPNILVSYDGGVKLVDFGIAKAESQSNQTRAGRLKGKFSYMSPEQIRAEPLDARSDVFALGIVLHELLAGQRLFKRDHELAIINEVLKGEVPLPSQLRPNVPKALDEIAVRALQKDKNSRFESAQQMQLALEKYLNGLPNRPTSLELSAYVLKLFQEEHAAYQRLLAELPTAKPDMAEYLSRDERSNSDSFSVSLEPEEVNLQVEPTPAPTRVSKVFKPMAVALVGLAALLILGASAFLFRKSSAPPPVTQGDVWVETDPPGAAVYVDNVKTRLVTPGSVPQLSLGIDHHLRFELAGHEARDVNVHLDRKLTSKSISVILPAVESKWGSLMLVTEPAHAKVLLDGQPQTGSTPVVLSSIRPGVPHTLKLSLDGFRDESIPISVEAGKTLELRVTLKPRSDNLMATVRELTTRLEDTKAAKLQNHPHATTPRGNDTPTAKVAEDSKD